MCGLIVYYKTSERPLEPRLLEEMTHSMTYRGPDDFGLCFTDSKGTKFWRGHDRPPPLRTKGVAMGHRRLSIFDLSLAGRQPFTSKDNRLTMVFNGEVYNYVELRDELIKSGFSFSTDCDTEVVLCAFQHWGTDCFNRFNGVWAIVIWDNVANELIACRDRLGEKPLFYAQVGEDWIFSSEMKPLFLHPNVSAAPNEQSLLHFIMTGAYPAGTQTFFSGISAVESGSILSITNGRVNSRKYWNFAPEHMPVRTDKASAIEELNSLITDAVRLRMRGDVRVGSMLSGGMDSTSVIASVTEVLESRPSESLSIGDKLQAFTASFTGMSIDETDKVEELCRSIDINVSKVYPVDLDRIEERLADVALKMEAPFWSPVVIVHDALMKKIRETDVQIVLDGMGADEIFGGFDWFLPTTLKDNLAGLRVGEAVGNLRGMKDLHGRNYLKEIARVVLPERFPEYTDNVVNLIRGKPLHWHTGLVRNEHLLAGVPSEAFTGRTRLERKLKDALLGYNTRRWCHMGDNMSMANSVVTRSPFLDHRMIDFAFSLDDSLKIHNGIPKYILREAKRNQLPDSIVNGIRKIQFSGSSELWINGPLKPFAKSLARDGNSRLSAFLHDDAMTAIVDGYYESGSVPTAVIWRLLNAEAWLKAFF
ncbi:MAG: asparagine synthase (glutamine-hydrolyzing) [Gammaproteobacteria bacterium]